MRDLADRGILRVRAGNPGPLTLDGTNTWVIGRDPAWVIDPGPAMGIHVEAVARAVEEMGGLGGIALTHDHADHAEGVEALRDRAGAEAPVAAARGQVDLRLGEGETAGPLTAIATPGHAPDHLAYVAQGAAFTGDAVLGHGSVFIAPTPGALAGYLDGLRRLRREPLDVLCPGHGPPVWDPADKLDGYIAHRLDRENRLLAALGDGLRREEQLLDAAWEDVPPPLRPAAALTLRAHLDKLAEEGRLPAGVEGREA